MNQPIHRIIDLIDADTQRLHGMTLAVARALLLAHPERVGEIGGSFAMVVRDGETVRLARSLERPLRYFLAKEKTGPMLVVAERIDEIRACLEAEGYGDQFHPSYTRMVPAHHTTTIQLVGCPDPNPVYTRFFDPQREALSTDLDAIGRAYVEALRREVRTWLASLPDREPIGVLFSGGIDSGAVLLAIHHELLALGQSPSRLKAFTLTVDGRGEDARQAREFLVRTGLEMLGETLEVPADALDPLAAVEVIEDYKPLDVECATVLLATLRAIRARYPDWRVLADGDGGDENLKDYPIEENTELTIRSVVNNLMLYQEGWGVDAMKHSQVYSGGLSRGCVRTWAPARRLGFEGFSPFTRPSVITVAEGIPFDALTRGSHDTLYGLKGDVVARGVQQVLDMALPVFPKRRFQHGAADEGVFASRLGRSEETYRRHFMSLHA